MAYDCPAWEFAADNHLMKLQRLQNKMLHTIGKFTRNTPIRAIHNAFQIPYVYNYITKLFRQQAQVTQSMKIHIFEILDKAKPNTENIRGLYLAMVKVNKMPL
jgi:hypothetical protein